MRKFLMLMCGVVMMSSAVFADDTTTPETCANGAGTVVIGAVTGHKYCMSNNNMNWWNAMAWCDAQGRRLVSLNNCGCSSTVSCNNICPEFKISDNNIWIWTSTPVNTTSYGVSLVHAGLHDYDPRNKEHRRAICKLN